METCEAATRAGGFSAALMLVLRQAGFNIGDGVASKKVKDVVLHLEDGRGTRVECPDMDEAGMAHARKVAAVLERVFRRGSHCGLHLQRVRLKMAKVGGGWLLAGVPERDDVVFSEHSPQYLEDEYVGMLLLAVEAKKAA